MTNIYLGGPINNCSDTEAIDWRAYCKETYGAYFNFLDPMKRDYRGIQKQSYREIVELDKIEIRNSDIVLANCSLPSAGTSMEIFYAHSLGKIVVSVLDYASSPWIRYHSTTVQPSIDDAFEWIIGTAMTVLPQ